MTAKSRRHFGTVRQLPSKKWQASYTLSHDRFSAPRTFATKDQARDWLVGQEADLLRGQWVDPRKKQLLVREYCDTWMQTRTGLSPRTRELYSHLLDVHILPTLGPLRIVDVRAPDVRSWFGSLSRRHASTAAKAYRLLSSIMRTAVGDEVIVRSPCTIRGAGTEPTTERPTVTPEEALKIADSMPEHLRALVILGAWCQLRRGELLGLEWKDIDLKNRTLTIRQSKTVLMSGGLVLKPPKTAAGRRTVAMPPIAVEALRRHKNGQREGRPAGPVFRGQKGGQLLAPVLQVTFKRATTKSGRPEVRLHDLRHSGLTWFAEVGATVAELMFRGGHASPAAAMRYQHATKERDRQLASKLSSGGKTA